jgi:hypothetical protein
MSITAVKYQNDTCNNFLFVLSGAIKFGGQMAKKTTQLLHIRVPKEFHRRIQREAERNGQTINAEILARLAWSFEAKEMLDAVERRVSKALKAVDREYAGSPTDEQTALIGTQQKEIERLKQRLSEYEKEAVESARAWYAERKKNEEKS